LLLDEKTFVAFIQLDERSSDDSLAWCLEDLMGRARRGHSIRVICLEINAFPTSPALHGFMIKQGAFMCGLRAVGLPVMSCIYGHVSGPSWSLLLAGDYRVSTADTRFRCPISSAPKCLDALIGGTTATELCMSNATLDGNDMLELGVLHQCQPSVDAAKMCVYEMAKRISQFPHVGCKQTMSLMSPGCMEYANAIGADPSLIVQHYPEGSEGSDEPVMATAR